MPTIRKVTEDITTVFKELKLVLGNDDPIVRSMKQYLEEHYTPVQNHLREILDGSYLGNSILYQYDSIKYMPESDSTRTGIPLRDILEKTGDFITLPHVPNTNVVITNEEVDYHFESYSHLIKWGLWVISNNIPDIFRTGTTEGYHTGTFGIYGFSVEFPNNICIRFHVHEEKGKIIYHVDIDYDHPEAVFFRESDLYKAAIKNGWKDLYQ
jgi:hypothetical protein